MIKLDKFLEMFFLTYKVQRTPENMFFVDVEGGMIEVIDGSTMSRYPVFSEGYSEGEAIDNFCDEISTQRVRVVYKDDTGALVSARVRCPYVVR